MCSLTRPPAWSVGGSKPSVVVGWWVVPGTHSAGCLASFGGTFYWWCVAVVLLCISLMIRDQTLLRDEHSFTLLFVRARVVVHVCSRRRAAHLVLSVVCEADRGVAGRDGGLCTGEGLGQGKCETGHRVAMAATVLQPHHHPQHAATLDYLHVSPHCSLVLPLNPLLMRPGAAGAFPCHLHHHHPAAAPLPRALLYQQYWRRCCT